MDENITVEAVTIDGRDYIITREIKWNNNIYYFLVNKDNYLDACLRRDDGEYLEPLSEEELNNVILLVK